MALQSYKYADNPTVYGNYKGNPNYAFTSAQEFLGAGGDWNTIQTRARPIQGSTPNLQGSAPKIQGSSFPANFQGPIKPPSSVTTSQQARTTTNKNLTSLAVSEAALSPQQAANNLSKVYSKRTDLQGLYNPDGTAKNPNDPRIAGIPTLADWANKFGQGEESLLKGFSSSPAVNAMLMQINQGLTNTSRSGATLGPDTMEQVKAVNNLTNRELTATAGARTAADEEDYRSLDTYMKELMDIRKNRDSMVAELLKSVQKSEEELKLSKQLGDLDQEARETKLGYRAAFNRANDKAIPMEMIRGQQESALRAANLQLERIATEQGPIINRLSLAQETRQNAVEALKIGIQAIDQDSDMVFKLASFAQELEKTKREEMKAARDFAIENNIESPFYNLAGTIYKTDGTKAYSNEQSFLTDAGVGSFQEAYDNGLLMDVKQANQDDFQLQVINDVPYLFNKATGELTQYEGYGDGTDPELTELLSPAEAERLGLPYGTTKGEALGAMPQASADQNKAAGYAARIQDSIKTFENTFKLFENGVYSGITGGLNYRIDWAAPNAKKPSYFQTHQQAAKNFINAVLRRESGATITPDEYKNAEEQYLPKPGDKPEVIQQKKQNMNRVLANFTQEAGPAWQQNKPDELFKEFESQPTSTSSGMRTDRHNNPTAFTTDIAKLAGLREGVDYTVGDSFSGGRYHTARLLGNPIESTIKVIDKIGFKTSSGGNRWTYTDSIPATKNWKNLTYEQKAAVIGQMYRHEGGTKFAQLF